MRIFYRNQFYRQQVFFHFSFERKSPLMPIFLCIHFLNHFFQYFSPCLSPTLLNESDARFALQSSIQNIAIEFSIHVSSFEYLQAVGALFRFMAGVEEDLWVTLKRPIVQSDRPAQPQSYVSTCIFMNYTLHLFNTLHKLHQNSEQYNLLY